MVADAYTWFKFLHVLAVLGFLAFHGVSMWVAFQLRTERDRARIAALLQFSGSAVRGMYVSLGLLLVFGVVGGFIVDWWAHWWIWIALVLLLGMVAEMTAVAKPYYQGVKEAVEVRPSGVPRRSDEELEEILRSRVALFNSILGLVALAVIAYLMVFKPF
jgi:hypothetical protein